MFDVAAYIEEKGIFIVRDEGQELACLCPFHNNTDSPAFYVNKNTGLWICFNPSCGKRGSVKDLMHHYGDNEDVFKQKQFTVEDIQKLLSGIAVVEEETDDWAETLDKIKVDLPNDAYKLQYLIDRGFEIETLKYFEVAYSDKKKRIVIPIRDERFKVIGFLGRAVNEQTEPKYLNSKGLPRKEHLFNLCNAKRFKAGIIVEGTTDAMKVFQAGYENVVASLGAEVTPKHYDLLNYYFDEIIIFSDNDTAGYTMRNKIIKNCSNKRLKIVTFDGDLHDPGQMTEDQIKSHIDGAKGFFQWAVQ